MIVVFVHGWSVTDTGTYGLLPEALSKQAHKHGLEIEIQHVWLGRYISFHDEVSVTDIARAFNRALLDQIPENTNGIKEFSCITHSTGGPVLREWLNKFYGAENLSHTPLKHLIMLAPANHGSSLAVLGKARVGRIKAWFDGVEPGQRVLDWLSLGSSQQFELARDFLDYKIENSGFFPFVLTGQSIDKKLYDFLNSYLTEAGSDGVVRVAGANMNFSMVKLKESNNQVLHDYGPNKLNLSFLEVQGEIKRPDQVPLGVIPDASHSGSDIGIMGSVLKTDSDKSQVEEILKSLTVKNNEDFLARKNELKELTKKSQIGKDRYSMLVFSVKDDQGDPVEDFDLILLGGEDYHPSKLTKGFFVDRQKNNCSPNHLIYYVNYDKIVQDKLTGFRIISRPSEGFAFYNAVEYRSTDEILDKTLQPNETFYFEIIIKRRVDENTFRLNRADDPNFKEKTGLFSTGYTRNNFKEEKPSKKETD